MRTRLADPSGSGKTTITRLLARFWNPASGRILLDDTVLRALEPDELYAQLATVLQDDYLLDATIGENVRTGRPTATDAELHDAIRAAGLQAGCVAARNGGQAHSRRRRFRWREGPATTCTCLCYVDNINLNRESFSIGAVGGPLPTDADDRGQESLRRE